VAATFCAKCGGSVPADATFCPWCGAAAASGAAPTGAPFGGGPPLAPTAPGPLPGGAPFRGTYPGGVYPGGPWGASPESLAATRARNAQALKDIQWAALLGLVGFVLGLVSDSVQSFASFVSVRSTSNGPVLSLANQAVFAAFLVTGLALALVGFLLYGRAFRTLRDEERGFSTPASLAVVAVIGLVLVMAGLLLFLVAIAQAIACAGTGNPLTSSCVLTGTFWDGVALLIVGLIVLLVGYIGILIGIWRVGTRFDNSLFKVGAILLIIPYLSVVGEILILVGVRQELGRR